MDTEVVKETKTKAIKPVLPKNELLKRFSLEITFTSEVLGSTPKDQAIFSTYIESKGKEVGKDTSDELASTTLEDVKGLELRGWTGFQSDERGPFLFDYVLKGFLKEAANVMKDELNLKNARSKMDSYLFVRPRKLYLIGDRLEKPVERSLRVLTMQGPRVTLARSDAMAAGTKFTAEIHLLPGLVTEEHLVKCLEYGKYKGLGQFRNGGYGSFEYTLKSL